MRNVPENPCDALDGHLRHEGVRGGSNRRCGSAAILAFAFLLAPTAIAQTPDAPHEDEAEDDRRPEEPAETEPDESPAPPPPADTESASMRARIEELAATVASQQQAIDRLQTEAQRRDAEVANVEEAAESAADETEQEEGSERTGVRAAANRHLGRFPDDATIVRGGEFEGSIRIPDTDVSVRIGGLVLTELAFDIDSLGFTDVLSPRTIPLDGTEGDDTRQLALNAFNSRINFDVRSDTSLGELRVFIEADFSVAGNEFLSTNPFSLRHAIAGIGALHIGQWWSSFSDTASFPETSSLGLPGGPAIRQAGIRYAPHIGEHLQLIGSLEVPRLDVAGVEGPDAQPYVPDIVGAVALTYPWFRLRVAGLFRYLDAGDETAPAGGINASGRIPLSFITDGTNLAFQLQYGTGIARYYGALQGLGLDGIVSDNGELATVEVLAGFVAYQQWWTPKWRTQIVASLLDLRLPSSAAPETLKRVTYYAVNLFWTPLDGLTFGVEALYATREQLSGAEGSGLRLHASARFDF